MRSWKTGLGTIGSAPPSFTWSGNTRPDEAEEHGGILGGLGFKVVLTAYASERTENHVA